MARITRVSSQEMAAGALVTSAIEVHILMRGEEATKAAVAEFMSLHRAPETKRESRVASFTQRTRWADLVDDMSSSQGDDGSDD